MEEYGITFGSYPGSEQDAVQVKNAGCNSLLDIQAVYRAVDVQTEQGWFKKHGFNYCINSPVTDVDEDEYCRSAFQAALKMEELINKQGQHVFLHDYTSISRAPTVIMIYFAVMCRHPTWRNLDELLQFLKLQYSTATPNMRVVKRVLELQKDYHQQCILRFDEDERNAANAKEDDRRQNKLTAAQEEAEILRLKRLAEEEAEKIRLQRIQFSDAERARLDKAERDQKERDRISDEKLKFHLRKMKELEDKERERQKQRRLKEEQEAREDEKTRSMREAELAAARKRLQLKREEVASLQDKRAKDHDDIIEAEKQRLYRIEKEMMERHKKDLEEQEAAEKIRIKKREEDEEQQRLR